MGRLRIISTGTISGDLTTTGDATVAGDLILDDGGSIKEAGGVAALTLDGSANITKLGQGSPSSSDVLTWDGAKWAPSAAAGGVAADDENLVLHMIAFA